MSCNPAPSGARCFGHTMHRLGVHCRTRARGILDYLQTTAPLYQQSVAIRKECDAEWVHHVPNDNGEAELVLLVPAEVPATAARRGLKKRYR
jgi:hypothetical protein